MGSLTIKGAGLGGLALLLGACGAEPTPPAPADPEERQAIADAEEMIAAGRPASDPVAEAE